MSLFPDDDPQLVRLALDATGVALWDLDLTTGVLRWNKRMLELTGSAEPLPPDRYLTHVHPEDRALVEETMGQTFGAGRFSSVPHRFVRPDGQVRWVQVVGKVLLDEAGKPTRVVGSTIDVTEQRLFEERSRAAHRLETMGELAAGISHNFNNLLATMLPALELALDQVDGDTRAALAEAQQAGRRASDLIRQVMGWAREPVEERGELAELDALVQHVCSLCLRFFEKHFRVVVEPGAGDARVRGSVAELEQAVMNLVINARDALRDAGTAHPTITVATRRAGEGMVSVSVRDNGPGIPPELQRRIFEPFFTTKPVGKGTGLGLATVLATVTKHGGTVRCDSRPGEGTLFELFLPTATASPGDAPLPPAAPALRGQGEVVLVVDDEAPVRRALTRLLERSGFKVLQAEDGPAALELLEGPDEVSVVLLDRAMPSMPGAAVVPGIRARRPGLRIVFHTGHDVPPEEAALVDAVLLKPARPEQLVAVLRPAARHQAP